MPKEEKLILDDLEINDRVVFRNGGVSVITSIEYHDSFGIEIVELVFDGFFQDPWYYELDGMMEVNSASAFDIITVKRNPVLAS